MRNLTKKACGVRPAAAGGIVATLAALAVVAPGAGAPPVVQTNWTILSATGSSHYTAKATLVGEPGPGDDWSFDADISVSWRQTARNARLPGSRTVSFNFTAMPAYVPGKASPQLNPIRDVAATVNGRAASEDYTGAHSCRFGGPVDKGFFSQSASSELFLGTAQKGGHSLVAYVRGQSPTFARPRAPCAGVMIPLLWDEKREHIKEIALSKVKRNAKPCTKTSLVLYRSIPVVEREETVGQVIEKAKITLQVPKYVKGRQVRCK